MSDYKDIIDLPHHVSKKRPHMTIYDRAAQFAPFAALTGYGDAVDETARFTEKRPLQDESALDELDEKFKSLPEGERVRITYFLADEKKEGGCMMTALGPILKTDIYRKLLLLEDGRQIPFGDIFDLELAPENED